MEGSKKTEKETRKANKAMSKPTTTQEQLEKLLNSCKMRIGDIFREQSAYVLSGGYPDNNIGSRELDLVFERIRQELTTLIETTRKETEEIDTRVHNKSNMFWLERSEDVSGVSGTGVVADGIIFPGGVTVLNWRTAGGSTAVYKSIEDVQRIHGHDGKTKVYFPYQDQYITESEEKSNK